MKQFFSWLLTINTPHEEIRRRGRNVIILTLGMIAICVLFLLLFPFSTAPAALYLTIIIPMLVYIGLLQLARRGYVTTSAAGFLLTISIGLFSSIWSTQLLSVVPFFMVLPLLIAGLTIRPWQIWVVLVVLIVGLLATFLALSSDSLTSLETIATFYESTILLAIVALMSFLGAKSTNSALAFAQDAHHQAEAAAQQLSRVNLDLEATVADRTAALQTALADVQARADMQAQLLAEIEQHRHAVRELSVPVIPISASTLIVPLIGALDSTRLIQLQEQALHALQHSSARYLVLDITGVPVVDSQVAQGLLAVVQAARLIGAEVMLVGIRPEVAQTIVGLGLSLQGTYTTSDLQSALSRIALS